MKFIYPDFLLALLLVAIPILIHLFNFRRFKKIEFTNVKFLRELKEETNSRSRLKHLLVLFSRILAITALVVAFAQPYIPVAESARIESIRTVNIYIDNSFSMEALSEDGDLITDAKNKAREIAMAYQPSDNFQILTNEFNPAHSRAVNREEFLELVDQVTISPNVKTISQVMARQMDALGTSGSGEYSAYLLSDFQRSTTDINSIGSDSLVDFTFIPIVSQATGNVYIDSCWFDAPVVQLNQSTNLNLAIVNSGPEPIENVPVKLNINGLQKSLTSVSLGGGQRLEIQLNFTIGEPGWQGASIEINDYPITFDDNYYFSFQVKKSVNVLAINERTPSKNLSALFSSDVYFSFENLNASRIDYSIFPTKDLIIINSLIQPSSGLAEELKKFTGLGGSVLIIPDSACNMEVYEAFMDILNLNPFQELIKVDEKISKLNLNHELFSGVFEKLPDNIDLPVVRKYYQQRPGTRSLVESIFEISDGTPVLSVYPSGKGKIFLFNISLNRSFSSLSSHAVFVPTVYRMAITSRRGEQVLSYTVGKGQAATVDEHGISGEEVFHLVNESLDFDIIPDHRTGPAGVAVVLNEEISRSGNYDLTFRDQKAGIFALNYDNRESALDVYSADELITLLDNSLTANVRILESDVQGLTKQLRDIKEGIKLWKIFIICALLFLLIEILLLKYFR